MKLSATILATAGMLCMSATVSVAQDCDIEYTIRQGDTLSRISSSFYDDVAPTIGAEFIFTANQADIRNKNQITEGSTLYIPCIGDGPINGDEPERVVAPITSLNLRQPVNVAFLTGTAFPPFSDETYDKGGMIPAMIETIMQFARDDSYNITFVNDWGAHLRVLLLERGAFDAAFPWYRPNCEKPARLDANGELRCRLFHFSRPLFSVGVEFYSNARSDLTINSVSDLEGLKICRPDGYFTFDLAEKGLLPVSGGDEQKIRLFQPGKPSDCFALLKDGSVDVVTMNSLLADAELSKVRDSLTVRKHDAVGSEETLHIIIPKTRPEGSALLRRLNDAIAQAEEEDLLEPIKTEYQKLFYFING